MHGDTTYQALPRPCLHPPQANRKYLRNDDYSQITQRSLTQKHWHVLSAPRRGQVQRLPATLRDQPLYKKQASPHHPSHDILSTRQRKHSTPFPQKTPVHPLFPPPHASKHAPQTPCSQPRLTSTLQKQSPTRLPPAETRPPLSSATPIPSPCVSFQCVRFKATHLLPDATIRQDLYDDRWRCAMADLDTVCA